MSSFVKMLQNANDKMKERRNEMRRKKQEIIYLVINTHDTDKFLFTI